MKKKIAMLVCGLLLSLGGHAQYLNDDIVFNQGKVYAGASLSGMDLNFNSHDRWKLDVGGKVGYMLFDDWMVLANAEFSYRKYDLNQLKAGGYIRYYIEQNGLYLGAGANYVHTQHTYDDFKPEVNVGYAFFISRTVTIEPELYYEQSLKSHSKYSSVGFRIGFGVYLD